MGKDNTALWVIGAIAAGYLLAPKEVKEDIGGTIGTITEKVTQFIPLPTGGGFGGGITKIFTGEGGGGLFGGEGGGGLFPGGEGFDLAGYLRDRFPWLFPGGEGEPEKPPVIVPPPAPTPIPTPTPTPEGPESNALGQKAATTLAGVGGFLTFAKIIGPQLAKIFAPRAFAALSGVAVPAVAAWTLADIITTGYEFLAGKNVPVLGWREIVYPNPERDASTQRQDEQVTAQEGLKIVKGVGMHLPEESERPSKPVAESGINYLTEKKWSLGTMGGH